jgi:F-type H+-transporting ATPase subunit b
VELSWTTFSLQVVNFLVLVWLLKRFLYKPVLEAIAQRRAAIDKSMSDAQSKEVTAHALVEQYQNRLADWENEKAKLRTGVVEEIAAQRAQMMAGLESALKQEREKARVLEERRLTELRNQAETAAVAKGVQFTARLLARAAGPDLDSRLVSLALEDLPRLAHEQIQALRSAVSQQSGLQIKVTSAFPLSLPQRSVITEKVKELAQANVAVAFNEDAGLLAGLRISIGPWVLRANIEDELEYFAAAINHEARKL